MDDKRIRLPRTIFVGFADFGRIGIGSAGDFDTDIEAAADRLSELMDEQHMPRAFRMDFDVETNALEAVTEVSDQVLAIISRRTRERGLENMPSLDQRIADWRLTLEALNAH